MIGYAGGWEGPATADLWETLPLEVPDQRARERVPLTRGGRLGYPEVHKSHPGLLF